MRATTTIRCSSTSAASGGAGRVPLWNPYENLGAPLHRRKYLQRVLSRQAAVRAAFGLRAAVQPLHRAARWLLAAATSYVLARHFGTSVLAAGLAAMSYAFSGSVLFQYCNVIFLVGAPGCRSRCCRRPHAPPSEAAVPCLVWGVLALMVLGGDPHMAYNAGLLVAFYALLLWRADRASDARAAGEPVLDWPRRRPVLLAMAAVVGCCWPPFRCCRRSRRLPTASRARYDSPRNIYELANVDGPTRTKRTGHPVVRRADRPPPDGDITARSIIFSMGPWRLTDWLWPNFSGKRFRQSPLARCAGAGAQPLDAVALLGTACRWC